MITDTEARRIASEWHGGGGTALYAFASTGAILGRRDDEYDYNSAADEIRANLRDNQDQYDRTELTNDEYFQNIDDLRGLLLYVLYHGPRGPQPGWSDLTW